LTAQRRYLQRRKILGCAGRRCAYDDSRRGEQRAGRNGEAFT